MNLRRYQPIVEALGLLAVTFPLAIALRLPTLWLLLPFMVITLTKRPYATYGLTWQQPGTARFHLAVTVGVFVPYVIGHYLWAHWWLGATFQLRLPPAFGQSIIDQVLIIALSEEFFFRGYLQTQCDQVWGKPYRLLGAECGPGLVAAAALFAVCHLFYGGPARLIVLFPGLLYGWLRARTGTIAVPVFYHAASNLLMQVMLTSLAG